MKRLFFAAVLATASTVSFAQSSAVATESKATPTPEVTDATKSDDVRKQIKIGELPAAVTEKLNTVEYKGWSPSVAYWVSDSKMNTEWYEITMVMGDESKIVKYNAEGSKLD